MKKDQKDWIDNATYTQLLARWRFAAVGDPIFKGETGKYYAKVLAEKKNATPAADAVAASKAIGWG
jgi:hypothetical protein